jgi:hypothetical protein
VVERAEDERCIEALAVHGSSRASPTWAVMLPRCG